MKSKYMKVIIPTAVVAMFAMAAIWGCGEPGFDGPKPVNKAPECYLANIPTSGTQYSKNPVLYWFASDEDGYIKEYRYVVKKADEINDDPLTYITNTVQDEDYDDWSSIVIGENPSQSPTTDTIQFFADIDPEIYVKQYFFVQAVDNHGAVSRLTDTISENGQQKISILAYRMFYRNNHAPNTHLYFEDTILYYSLDTLYESYDGIPFSWEGSDSLDYKRAQPKFEFHWQLYGPFDSIDDTSTSDPSKLVRESYDSTTNSVWVEQEGVTLYDLYDKAPPSSETRTKWFTFKVMSRDDAFVADPEPEITAFRVLEPKFEKDVLLIDNNTYFPGSMMILTARDIKFYGKDDPRVLMFQERYSSIFEEAGYPVDDLYFHLNTDRPTDKRVPGVDTLVKYKLVIMVADNCQTKNDGNKHWTPLANYMDIGGKVMLIGWNNFNPNIKPRGFLSFASGAFENHYFGINGEYMAGWGERDNMSAPYDEWWWYITGITNEEMVQAVADERITGLPLVLSVDSNRLDDYFIAQNTWIAEADTVFENDTTVVRSWFEKNNYPFKQNAEPWVNYFEKDPSAEALYIANSLYDNPRDFKFSGETIDGKPIAVRKDGGLYKTAVFGFSLYCRPKAEAVELMRGMIEWFLEE